jgi:hypothetical protein
MAKRSKKPVRAKRRDKVTIPLRLPRDVFTFLVNTAFFADVSLNDVINVYLATRIYAAKELEKQVKK